jgi:hypothetical protein
VGVKTPIEETPTEAYDCGHMNAGHVDQQYARRGWWKREYIGKQIRSFVRLKNDWRIKADRHWA